PGNRRQGADRGGWRLHGNLLVGLVQRLFAAEDLSHLTPPVGSTLSHTNNALGTRARLRARAGASMKMISIRKERPPDAAARESLLDEAFGRLRWRKGSQRLRDGQLPADDLAFVATEGKRVIGTARLWNIAFGTGQRALLLGPVAIASDCRNRGVGTALVRHALAPARPPAHPPT